MYIHLPLDIQAVSEDYLFSNWFTLKVPRKILEQTMIIFFYLFFWEKKFFENAVCWSCLALKGLR